ncbi:MAG: hypothetical protein ACYC3P_11160 [Bellilinea sp.]
MNEETIVDGQAHDPQAASTDSATGTKTQPASGPTLKGAWKQVENIGQTLGEALQGRGNVVMVRVNDETLAHLDMLVEGELARSRSEAAALLIREGMKANAPLFERIRQITDQIAALRGQLRQSVQDEEAIHSKQEGEE